MPREFAGVGGVNDPRLNSSLADMYEAAEESAAVPIHRKLVPR